MKEGSLDGCKDTEGAELGTDDGAALTDGCEEVLGTEEGSSVDAEGLDEREGTADTDGSNDGCDDGCEEGAKLGTCDGTLLGDSLGAVEMDGFNDGSEVG